MLQTPRKLRPPVNGIEERLDHLIDMMVQQLGLSKPAVVNTMANPDGNGEFEVRESTADQPSTSNTAQTIPVTDPVRIEIPEQSTLSAPPLPPATTKKGKR